MDHTPAEIAAVRILMVTGAIPHAAASSGSSVVMAGQLAAMAARHRVTLVTFPPASSAQQKALADWRAAGVAVHSAGGLIPPSVVQIKRRIERAVRNLRPRGPRLEPITGDARTQAVIDRLIETDGFDVIQAENIGVGHFRYPAFIPKVLTEQEVGRHGGDGADSWRTQQPSIWADFDRVQVFTSQDAERFRSAAPSMASRVRVNPFGIDLPVAADPEQQDPNAVVFVGSFNHEPNVDAAAWLATDILPGVLARHVGVKLWLVGEDPPKTLTGLASPAITITGRVADVTPFLQTAAVVVAPVRTGGGMRRKVLEAMALGKAIVTTRLGAEGLVGPSERLPLILADTSGEFSNQVTRLLESPQTRQDLGARARAYVAEHHSWTAHADRLDAIYGELGLS